MFGDVNVVIANDRNVLWRMQAQLTSPMDDANREIVGRREDRRWRLGQFEQGVEFFSNSFAGHGH